ncbi:MAG: hypothetical protein OXF58_09130 [Gammaproteobacteria bacterium]|nr:hypothetical protein [Gammaproteobacteria bacterium]
MNRNVLIITLLLGIGIPLYLLFDPGKDTPHATATPVARPQTSVPVSPQPDLEAQAAARRAAMRAEYAKLEQARTEVRQQLGRLKAGIWKLRVPPEQARVIEKRLYQGHVLLQNPPLLGAFSGLEDLSRELQKVNSVRADLEHLAREIEADG